MTRVHPVPPRPTVANPIAAKDVKLRQAATQLEGAFVEQMYKTMRSTVPTDGMFNGGSGEDMFTSLMDQHVAADTPGGWQHGLSEAIYRQLRAAVHRQAGDLTTAAAGTAGAVTAADAASAGLAGRATHLTN